MFALAGVMKSAQPKEKLVGRLPWTADVLQGTVRLTGLAEFAAALGLRGGGCSGNAGAACWRRIRRWAGGEGGQPRWDGE